MIEAKALSTLQARLALQGFQLVELADASFLVCRWGRAKPFADLAAVESFTARIEVPVQQKATSQKGHR